jgi:hypothetical protein
MFIGMSNSASRPTEKIEQIAIELDALEVQMFSQDGKREDELRSRNAVQPIGMQWLE